MKKRELIHKELEALYYEGSKLLSELVQKNEKVTFEFHYQRWYTKALSAVSSLAADRLAEFKSYYEIDQNRKNLDYGTFVMQDYIKKVKPAFPSDFDIRERAIRCFLSQLTIVDALCERVDSVLANIEGELYAELQDGELEIARELAKASFRAAGALVGVVIEGHLQKVASSHGKSISKKNPTIADLNDLLKAASIVDTPEWRKISYLADLRNICAHKKDTEPTKEQVEELIQGAEWLTKNVF